MMNSIYLELGIGSKVKLEESNGIWQASCPPLGPGILAHSEEGEEGAKLAFGEVLQDFVDSFQGNAKELKTWLFDRDIEWSVVDVLGEELAFLGGTPHVRIFIPDVRLCAKETCAKPVYRYSRFCGLTICEAVA